MKPISLLLKILTLTLISSVTSYAEDNNSSQKMIYNFSHIIPQNAVLIHSQSDSKFNFDNQNGEVLFAFHEEWYQDKTNVYWYLWQEKRQTNQGTWEITGSGIANIESEFYKPQP